jgi:hypothetical protein
MIKGQFQKRLDFKWLSTRARLWGVMFRTLDTMRIIRFTVLAERNKFRVEVKGAGTLWIVTSVIKPKKTPFSYIRSRSVFEEGERIAQTAKTVHCLHASTLSSCEQFAHHNSTAIHNLRRSPVLAPR